MTENERTEKWIQEDLDRKARYGRLHRNMKNLHLAILNAVKWEAYSNKIKTLRNWESILNDSLQDISCLHNQEQNPKKFEEEIRDRYKDRK